MKVRIIILMKMVIGILKLMMLVVDGIPNTGDEGEGDGVPTLGNRLPDGRPDPLATW